jgi:glutamyl-tRNA synthetase
MLFGGFMTQEVRVRFAPSPTGYLHIGGVRTAIFNYLMARRYQGAFILRIEDTDTERNTQEAVEQILESLRWLELDWDEGPLFQSERMDIYKEHLDRLLAEGKAYRCYCKQEDLDKKRAQAEKDKVQYKYDGTCRDLDPQEDPAGRPFTVRVRMPAEIPDSFDDLILGQIPIDQTKLDDWIVARTNGTPTYNFCVVVDDATMQITHVIRGNDHVSNTPRQIMLYQAFGYPIPKFAHMPLTHGPDGSKLSKRKEEEYKKLGISVSSQEYGKMGYLPHALINYLCRLGWSHGDQEIFSKKELEEKFDLDGVGKSAGVIDPEKLKWLNAHYIQESSNQELAKLVQPFLAEIGIKTEIDQRLSRIAETLKKRSKTLAEMAQAAKFYFNAPTEYDPKSVKKWWKANAAEILLEVRKLVEATDIENGEAIEEMFRKLAEEKTEGKLGKVAQPVRLALVGTTVSPSLFEVISILGKPETIQRIDNALTTLKAKSD